jgi:hypothetical protein
MGTDKRGNIGEACKYFIMRSFVLCSLPSGMDRFLKNIGTTSKL